MKRKNSGVTLIALIITIIVLFILAGVTIAMIVGDNGILNRAADAAVQTEQASIKEALDLAYSDYQLEFLNMYLEMGDSTRVASLDIVEVDRYATIPAPAPEHGYFWYYLVEVKKCMNEDGLIDVESLVGSELSTGKGNIEDGTDIYLLTEIGGDYVVTYYDDNSNSKEIWRTSEYSTNTVEIKYSSGEVAVEIEYVEGMTWDDWRYSKLYVDGFDVYGRVDYIDSEGITHVVAVKNDEGETDPVSIDDLITNENEYVLINTPT